MRTEALTYYQNKISAFKDANKRIFKRNILRDKSKIKSIHLSGICGTAMGSLAVLLKKSGFNVSGSDTHCYPPMSNLIEELGIKFFEGYDAKNLEGADLIIIGNVCSPDNPEALHARTNNLPTLSLPEALEVFFIKGNKSIVVAGTHGKTTTTGLLTHIFRDTGRDPSFLIGGVPKGDTPNANVGKGGYFIIEGDEYDSSYFNKAPKFLHYLPNIAIITSLEFDHVDIYKDINEYTDAFKFLLREVPEDGLVVLCGDNQPVRDLAPFASSDIDFYGLGETNDIRAKDVVVGTNGQEFELVVRGNSLGRINLSLYGNHNLLNSLACIAVALKCGLSIEEIKKTLSNFEGVKRRQEVIFDEKITIIDDFAHHPTAVKETLLSIRAKYPNRRLVAFFEPRSNTSRRHIFEKEYGQSFDVADLVFISTPPLKENDNPSDFINPKKVVDMINTRNQDKSNFAQEFSNADELLKSYEEVVQEGDVVLIMSNGSFDGIHEKLVNLEK